MVNPSRRVANLKSKVDEATAQTVVTYAIAYAAYGQHSTSNKLSRRGIFVSGSSRPL